MESRRNRPVELQLRLSLEPQQTLDAVCGGELALK